MGSNSELYNTNNKKGILLAFAAYGLWGVLPLYWKIINEIMPIEILCHRIFWSFVFIGALVIFRKQLGAAIQVLKSPKLILSVSLCACLITLNWGIYIWAVNSGHIIDASMGYYINPLVSVLLGVIVLKEKIKTNGIIAIVLAFCGVLFMTLEYGKVPWIAVSLALSFAFYGLIKKIIPVDSITSLFLETVLIMPFALIFIVSRQSQGVGSFGVSAVSTFMLICSGIVTATPLLLFAMSAKLSKLSTLGFVQYISPTISMILGIILYGEKFTLIYVIGFGLIWAGIIIYAIPQFIKVKTVQIEKYVQQ